LNSRKQFKKNGNVTPMETAPGINDSTNPHRYKSRKLFLAGRSVQSWAVLTGQKGKWQYAADRMANGSMLLTVSI